MQKHFRIQHYLISRTSEKLIIKQEQHAEAKRAAKFALFLLAVSFFIGPYGPQALQMTSVEVFWISFICLTFSAAMCLYFSRYEKTWGFGPTSVTVTDYRKRPVVHPVGAATYAETEDGPCYLGPGTDRINSFPYLIHIHLDVNRTETLKFCTKPGSERVLSMIKEVLPNLPVRPPSSAT